MARGGASGHSLIQQIFSGNLDACLLRLCVCTGFGYVILGSYVVLSVSRFSFSGSLGFIPPRR